MAVSLTACAAAGGRNGPSSSFSGAAKTPCPVTVPGSPAPPSSGGSGRLARVRGPGATIPVGGTKTATAGLSSSPRCRRASTRRHPAAAPPIAAATRVRGSASSSSTTARPFWASAGVAIASDRPTERARSSAALRRAARGAGRNSSSKGSIEAAPAPRAHAVSWYASASRSRVSRNGAWPTTSRTREGVPEWAMRSPARPIRLSDPGVASPITTLEVPSWSSSRSDARRAATDRFSSDSRRPTKLLTARSPSSNASQGFRSRQA